MHHLIGFIQGFRVQMERVGILHDELAGAHHAKPRPALIAELGLDLVEVGRQLFVAFQFVPDQIGDNFFMSRAEAEIAAMAVVQAQQFSTVLFPAAGFLPQFGGLYRRHQNFLGAALVHFFTDDSLHLTQGAQP